MSSREEGVQASLVTCVQALDSLQRVETPTAVRVLLRLAAVVHGSNFDPGCSMPTSDELAFAAIGLSEHGRLLLLEVLTKAQTLGLLSAEDVQRISTDSTATTTPTALQELARTSSLDVSGAFSSTLSEVSRNLISKSTALHESLHQRPAIQVDPASLLSARTTASWGPESNLLVTVHGLSDTSQQLWARARYDADGSIVAVAPLTANGASLTATLLIPERDHVVLDVVYHAADRVITENVGALGRAFDLGRRAGRLERLGRITEASALWEECAAAHGQAGDFQRQKMALSRLSLQRSIQAATFIDHVL